MKIPFHRSQLTGDELGFLQEAVASGRLEGDGPFTHRCQEWFERNIGCARAFLTHSCTDALEMAALLADIQPGDEVILPSLS